MRPVLPALAAAALLLAGLAACSGTPAGTSDAKGCPAAPAGDASNGIKVSGKSGAEPKVSFSKGLKVDSTQRTVITGGNGTAVKEGDTIQWSYSLYNGTSGKKIGAIGYTKASPAQEFPISSNTLVGLAHTLVCTNVGSRVAAVIPPEEAFGTSGQSQLGLGASDDLVVVADVVKIVPPLKPSSWTKDVPTVDTSADIPKVTLPDTAAPTKLEMKVLKKGTGKTVESSSQVTVDYQGTSWDTKEIFDQSYGKTPAQFTANQLVKGFTAAIVGQKAGAQLLVVIPPEYAYGAKSDSNTNDLAGQTLVFLIDIEKVG
jgi:peptidylprolyl isomerase